ncbi:hypothetical protein [Leptothermofonsia sp. ETS-13]|uniref:hypothetical protein n=1 Tax=Leptothermofonsia sp. ETS-13 TaxID=3035696 RepID=UPI003B9F0EA5
MLSPTFPQSAEKSLTLEPKVLESREQYCCCHIQLPGDEQRTAAIRVSGKYYSLVKVVKEYPQAIEICRRLLAKGRETLITKIAKGNAIWMFEPDASFDVLAHADFRPIQSSFPAPTCKILGTQPRYQLCQIYLPDLDDRIEAILLDGKYYGLFKVVETRQQALELAARLGRRGDETVITQTEQGKDAIWVLEPDARLAHLEDEAG